MEDLGKSPSCHGVSFEMRNEAVPARHLLYKPMTLNAWKKRSNSKIFPGHQSGKFTKSLSRGSSSHFCDLDIEGDEEEGDGDEEQQAELDSVRHSSLPHITEEDNGVPQPPPQPTFVKVPSKKAAKSGESRMSVILLDQGLLTVYKRLFLLSFALNLTALILAATGHFSYAKKEAALFSVGNILALVLCRNEAFLRCVFWLVVKVLGRSWVPLPLKTGTTSFLQCVGGIHSGCGVSSVMWLTYSLVETLRHSEITSPEIRGVASAILALLVISSLAAFPLVRHLHHNVFEGFHRFSGWTALALLWVFVMLSAAYVPAEKSYRLRGSVLAKKQDFWFTLIITVLIILPWVSVRKVPVQVSVPSGHASLIKFPSGIKAGLLGRISRSPLSDWHAFGIISDGKDEHMMLAGAVGDFTKSLVSDPPKYLYTRCVKFAGLPYLINMYNKVVVVATGSGICVFLSFMLQPCPAEVYVIWVAKAIEKNFGDDIVKRIKSYPSEKIIIHDTAFSGRPNVPQMTVDAVKKWGAEVVIVTSNPSGSRDVVNGCKAAGIPAFGPIWDS
ncbi:hypothetical protein SUGI_0771220 [Cryptomeria japonica]|uniref:adenylate-forming reductase 03009-like n=1 Tax=Cryptomeria japonica TaxID=3369 RepID=UPI002414C163|nr:adenylate-forming reductase 03009-like [Cryptomeria japonica]GLJ37908.1 hypothetical protein SUGI_0771220 [Cryptomeria japonica]